MNNRILVLAFSVSIILFLPLSSLSQADSEKDGVTVPGGLLSDDAQGPVGVVAESHKFDEGFYEKVRGLMSKVPQDGEPGIYDGTHYYSVIIMDMDGSDRLYVTNKDDDNVVRMTSGGTASVFATGGLDDPRGVTVGPQYSPSSSSSESFGQSEGAGPKPVQNDGPEFEATYVDGSAVDGSIHTAGSETLAVTASDPDEDQISIRVIHDMMPEDSLAVTDHGNGTAIVTIDASGMQPGSYVFWITAHGTHDDYEREPYVVVVP